MSQVVPIIIPVNHEPNRCPKCERIENKIEVCKHCGHEYEESELTAADIILAIVFIAVIVWIVCTVIFWLAQSETTWYRPNPKSLFEVIESQWEWLKNLKVF